MSRLSVLLPVTYLVVVCLRGGCVEAQIAWTPIYVSRNSQIDLWTQDADGCECPWDSSRRDCACCVMDGGCHCGRDAPNRCTQCGLEQHCSHMCNITITATELYAKSGKTFGQIKSPSLEGPNACWYTFIPTAHQRVEVQIYRLVNTGKHNGTSCYGGYLQLMSGSEPIHSPHENQLCGSNERYTPPVVFFSDDGIATLLFEITEKTWRSQFLAYFSFSSINSTDGLGFQPHGGMRLQNTDCDWLYRDFECQDGGGQKCVLASPGYPGVYPPHRQCKYHITTVSENVLVRITFTSLLLNEDNCKTDYVAIYKGTTTSSPILDTLCGTQRKKLEYCGTNLLIEFRSGPQIPPFEYNGFVANLQFLERRTTQEPDVTLPPLPQEKMIIYHHLSNDSTPTEAGNFSGCDILISGNNTRFGHFDTREYDWYPVCRITFRGRPTDIVQIMLYNFRLRAPNCKTVVEVFDGPLETKKHIIEKLCSPQMKQARDPDDLYNKKLWSSKNELVIFLQRSSAPLSTNEAEFLAGRFIFHDEEISGTVKPAGVCDVVYRGTTGPTTGLIDNNSLQHFLAQHQHVAAATAAIGGGGSSAATVAGAGEDTGQLQCSQQFVPAANQSVSVRVRTLTGMSRTVACVTQCGDHGCRCVASSPLSRIDHVLIVNGEGWTVACLCGSYHVEWLPVSVRSWGSLTLVYSVAEYGAAQRGYVFSADYAFNSDTICGQQTYTKHTGEIVLNNLTVVENLNHFYEQSCTWSLHSNVERQLELEISSIQNRPCTAWNISIHEYNPNDHKHHLGEVLHTFCSRDTNKVYLLPWKVNTVIVRLHTLSRTLPQFRIKWKSQVVRSNTRFVAAPTATPNAVSIAPSHRAALVGVVCVVRLVLSLVVATLAAHHLHLSYTS